MKIPASRADAFAASPDTGVRAILIYGPDTGLVRERLNVLTRAIAGTTDDPFRVSEFSADQLCDDPARLGDEAAALALTGGRRVVRIRDATDVAGQLFSKFLDDPVGDALILVEGGDLGPRSKLRAAFEKADEAATLPCYSDDARSLEGLIHSSLKTEGVSITPDALAWLTSHLGGDRAQTRREIEKLIVYAGSDTESTNLMITEDDVLACVGDNAAMGLDDLIYALGDGDQTTAQRIYGRLVAEAVSPISTLTSVVRHFMRLHETRGRLADGKSMEQATASLRPPVFFKHKRRFQSQANRWSEDLITRGLQILMEAELAAKSTDVPTAAVVERALIQIAHVGRNTVRR
jgi:DNA polymerase III subunit delta